MGSYPQVLPEYLEHLRCITCGAAPLPTADIEKFLSKLKVRFDKTIDVLI